MKGKNVIKKTVQFVSIFPYLPHFRVQMSHDVAEEAIRKVYQDKPLYTREIVLKEDNRYQLSIIIPAYNCQNTIEKCIQTLTNQKTDYSYEVIIVNDGSTDQTGSILDRNQSEYVKVISQKNGGASMARNSGLMEAQGEYVIFFDSDDYAEPDYVQKLLKNAYSYDADIVKCGFFFENGNHVVKKVYKPVICKEKKDIRVANYDGYIWNMCMKRKLWKKYMFPEKWWYEDMITKLVVMRSASSFVYIAEPLYHYRVFRDSLSKSVWKPSEMKSIDQLWLVKKILENSDQLGLEKDFEEYKLVLNELGTYLFSRTKKLDMKLKKAIFTEACYLIDRYYPEIKAEDKRLNKQQKRLTTAFHNRNMLLWAYVWATR